jgi:hypothetical protein
MKETIKAKDRKADRKESLEEVDISASGEEK